VVPLPPFTDQQATSTRSPPPGAPNRVRGKGSAAL
jgi:hypothetical protein